MPARHHVRSGWHAGPRGVLTTRSPGGTAIATGIDQPRTTRQRTAVSEVLDEVEDFRSAQDIHGLLRARGTSIGLATVYRALQSLLDAGSVDVLRTDDGESVYRRCSTAAHHHHLVCRRCGRTVEVEGPAVERWAQRVGADHGFTDVEHTIEVFGTCAECARRG